MSLKRWFYRGGHPNRVARLLERGTAALHAQSRREVGTVTGMRLSRIGGLLVFVGAVAFVLHVVWRSVLTAGVDPAVSALWVLVGNFVIAPGGPASNLSVNLLSNLGPVLLLIWLGYLGFLAWAEPSPAKHAGPTGDV